VEIVLSPVALNESEANFIKDLRRYLKDNEALFSDKELYIIRNRSKKELDFLKIAVSILISLCGLLSMNKQYITFIDPHGLRQESITSSKISLHKIIKTDIQSRLAEPTVVLNSFILSPTKYAELPDRSISKAEWVKIMSFLWKTSITSKDFSV